MRIDILSLFINYFYSPFNESIIKKARERGLLDICLTDIRDFSVDKHHRVDDRPYGGGPGMVMMAEPVVKAIRHVRTENSHVVYLSPQGMLLTAKKCRSLALNDHLILLCGHYEGIDERAIERDVDEKISIGDYVLTNGCLSAIVLVDAMSRFIPGVLGNELSVSEDSFENDIFDYPHYTRPRVFENNAVPEVLLSGSHQEINKWRNDQALARTRANRPDLLQKKEK